MSRQENKQANQQDQKDQKERKVELSDEDPASLVSRQSQQQQPQSQPQHVQSPVPRTFDREEAAQIRAEEAKKRNELRHAGGNSPKIEDQKKATKTKAEEREARESAIQQVRQHQKWRSKVKEEEVTTRNSSYPQSLDQKDDVKPSPREPVQDALTKGHFYDHTEGKHYKNAADEEKPGWQISSQDLTQEKSIEKLNKLARDVVVFESHDQKVINDYEQTKAQLVKTDAELTEVGAQLEAANAEIAKLRQQNASQETKDKIGNILNKNKEAQELSVRLETIKTQKKTLQDKLKKAILLDPAIVAVMYPAIHISAEDVNAPRQMDLKNITAMMHIDAKGRPTIEFFKGAKNERVARISCMSKDKICLVYKEYKEELVKDREGNIIIPAKNRKELIADFKDSKGSNRQVYSKESLTKDPSSITERLQTFNKLQPEISFIKCEQKDSPEEQTAYEKKLKEQCQWLTAQSNRQFILVTPTHYIVVKQNSIHDPLNRKEIHDAPLTSEKEARALKNLKALPTRNKEELERIGLLFRDKDEQGKVKPNSEFQATPEGLKSLSQLFDVESSPTPDQQIIKGKAANGQAYIQVLNKDDKAHRIHRSVQSIQKPEHIPIRHADLLDLPTDQNAKALRLKELEDDFGLNFSELKIEPKYRISRTPQNPPVDLKERKVEEERKKSDLQSSSGEQKDEKEGKQSDAEKSDSLNEYFLVDAPNAKLNLVKTPHVVEGAGKVEQHKFVFYQKKYDDRYPQLLKLKSEVDEKKGVYQEAEGKWGTDRSRTATYTLSAEELRKKKLKTPPEIILSQFHYQEIKDLDDSPAIRLSERLVGFDEQGKPIDFFALTPAGVALVSFIKQANSLKQNKAPRIEGNQYIWEAKPPSEERPSLDHYWEKRGDQGQILEQHWSGKDANEKDVQFTINPRQTDLEKLLQDPRDPKVQQECQTGVIAETATLYSVPVKNGVNRDQARNELAKSLSFQKSDSVIERGAAAPLEVKVTPLMDAEGKSEAKDAFNQVKRELVRDGYKKSSTEWKKDPIDGSYAEVKLQQDQVKRYYAPAELMEGTLGLRKSVQIYNDSRRYFDSNIFNFDAYEKAKDTKTPLQQSVYKFFENPDDKNLSASANDKAQLLLSRINKARLLLQQFNFDEPQPAKLNEPLTIADYKKAFFDGLAAQKAEASQLKYRLSKIDTPEKIEAYKKALEKNYPDSAQILFQREITQIKQQATDLQSKLFDKTLYLSVQAVRRGDPLPDLNSIKERPIAIAYDKKTNIFTAIDKNQQQFTFDDREYSEVAELRQVPELVLSKTWKEQVISIKQNRFNADNYQRKLEQYGIELMLGDPAYPGGAWGHFKRLLNLDVGMYIADSTHLLPGDARIPQRIKGSDGQYHPMDVIIDNDKLSLRVHYFDEKGHPSPPSAEAIATMLHVNMDLRKNPFQRIVIKWSSDTIFSDKVKPTKELAKLVPSMIKTFTERQAKQYTDEGHCKAWAETKAAMDAMFIDHSDLSGQREVPLSIYLIQAYERNQPSRMVEFFERQELKGTKGWFQKKLTDTRTDPTFDAAFKQFKIYLRHKYKLQAMEKLQTQLIHLEKDDNEIKAEMDKFAKKELSDDFIILESAEDDLNWTAGKTVQDWIEEQVQAELDKVRALKPEPAPVSAPQPSNAAPVSKHQWRATKESQSLQNNEDESKLELQSTKLSINS